MCFVNFIIILGIIITTTTLLIIIVVVVTIATITTTTTIIIIIIISIIIIALVVIGLKYFIPGIGLLSLSLFYNSLNKETVLLSNAPSGCVLCGQNSL
jgi:hypothetical protein